MARDHSLTIDKELCTQVVALRKEEKKWAEIAEITGVASGKCMLAYAVATVPKGEKIKDATPKDVVRLRDEQALSWGEICARTGFNENACRSMYEEATGNSTKGNRIGKGGRHPGDAEAAPKAKKSGKASKAAAKEQTFDLFDGKEPDEVKEMLAGFAIKYMVDGAEQRMKIKSVKTVKNGKAILVDMESGESRTIKLNAIKAISPKKVK